MAALAGAPGGDWTAPAHPLWAPFARCIENVVKEWDVLRAAVDGGWGDGNPREEEAKLLDDLCANFADSWKANRTLEPIEITNFFVGTMDDVFACDLDSGIVTPISKLLVTLYDEARNGVDTGIKTVQARFDEKAAQEAVVTAAAAAQRSAARAEATATGGVAGDADTEMAGADDDSGEAAATDAGPTAAVVDEDGWETVPVRRRGRGPN